MCDSTGCDVGQAGKGTAAGGRVSSFAQARRTQLTNRCGGESQQLSCLLGLLLLLRWVPLPLAQAPSRLGACPGNRASLTASARRCKPGHELGGDIERMQWGHVQPPHPSSPASTPLSTPSSTHIGRPPSTPTIVACLCGVHYASGRTFPASAGGRGSFRGVGIFHFLDRHIWLVFLLFVGRRSWCGGWGGGGGCWAS